MKKMNTQVIIFLSLFLLVAPIVMADNIEGGYSGTMEVGDPSPYPVGMEMLDRVTFFGNGFVEFEWFVDDDLSDGSHQTVIARNAKDAETSGDGLIQVIFEQSHLDRPIMTSELRVHVADRDVVLVHGKVYPLVQNLDPGEDVDPTNQEDLLSEYFPEVSDATASRIRLVYYPHGVNMLLGFEYSEEVADGDYVEIRDRDMNLLFSATTYQQP